MLEISIRKGGVQLPQDGSRPFALSAKNQVMADQTALSDEALALGIQAGARHDLALLVERHHGRLLGYLYRMVNGDRLLAEDLVQDTFLRMLKSIDQYRYPRPFKPWLYTIATNLARDHYKQADTRHTQSAPEETEFWQMKDNDVSGVEQNLVAHDTAAQVAQAIQSLPEHQREVIVLRYYQDFSLADIGATLGIPVGTVKSRLSLGIKQLRWKMEG